MELKTALADHQQSVKQKEDHINEKMKEIEVLKLSVTEHLSKNKAAEAKSGDMEQKILTMTIEITSLLKTKEDLTSLNKQN